MSKDKPIVAYYASSYLPLTENWIYHQLRSLEKYEAIFLTRRKHNLDKFPCENIFSLSDLDALEKFWELMLFKGLGYFVYQKKACLRFGVDLLHAHFGYHGSKLVGLKRKLKVPLVCSFYGDDAYSVSFANRTNYRELFDYADKILVLGPSMKAQLVQLGCLEEKISIHHLGIDLNRIQFRKRSRSSKIKFLIASSFLEKKGVKEAVMALDVVANTHDFELEIIGDGPLRQEIEVLINNSSLKSRTILYGYKPYDFFIEKAFQCNIFVQASKTSTDNRKEGTPMAIADVMATGMPVVGTRHSDIPELVLDGVNGYLAKEGDISSLVKALMHALSNVDRLEEMGGNAREHVEREFDLVKQGKKLEIMYNSLIN